MSMRQPADVDESVLVPIAVAASVTRFSQREIVDLATRRPILIRSVRRGGALLIHLGDACDCSDLTTPIEPVAFDEGDVP